LAKVLTSFKVFPSNVETDLNRLKEEIKAAVPKEASVVRFDEEPVAFGLVALIVHVTVPESMPSKVDEVEEAIKSLGDVSEIQVLSSSRV